MVCCWECWPAGQPTLSWGLGSGFTCRSLELCPHSQLTRSKIDQAEGPTAQPCLYSLGSVDAFCIQIPSLSSLDTIS